MKIERIKLTHLCLPLTHHFETSFGRVYHQDTLIIKVYVDGITGYGESAASANPYYSAETVYTCAHIIKDFLAPLVKGAPVNAPSELPQRFARVRGNNIAKAGVEMALWDVYAQMADRPLCEVYGGAVRPVPAGVSLGITDTVDELLAMVKRFIDKGYKRVKVKIKPGWDVEVVARIRDRFPNLVLSADANAAYNLADIETLKALDRYNLQMIEQPLDENDLICHSKLQPRLKTPICLDESIKTPQDAVQALDLGSCRVINIKQARLGGFTNAKKVHDICFARGVPVWCGGLLETGIGRLHNVALATLPNFILPNDISESARYYEKEVVDPPVMVNSHGEIEPSPAPGLGAEVNERQLDHYAITRVEC